jgi:hypothetical protein
VLGRLGEDQRTPVGLVVTARPDAAESASEYGNFAGMMFDWGDFGRNLGQNISRRAQEAAERAARKQTAGGVPTPVGAAIWQTWPPGNDLVVVHSSRCPRQGDRFRTKSV